ncbi:MAG: TIGR02391 family protein [Deltaproteobacteria bacterium]|nr:TIGR02391 family protein [Deltaproteobacteria bacterium]MBI3390982.1 TIGR02391 family protein [Deltaproteobacteria bacterium]
MERVPPFESEHLTSIARILADTAEGLTGSQIEHMLRECRIPDPSPGMTKWKRLYNAFVEFQNQRHFGNHVVIFINRTMKPVQYTADPGGFESRRDQLNAVLSFSGLYVGDDGKIRWARKATNLDEALERAGRLHSALINRGVHDDVLHYCRAELLQENYFHAVFEATKSIAVKIRTLSGLTSDGAELAQGAFGQPKDGSPSLLAINDLRTDTDRGEQRGFTNLLIGLFGTVRNPLAHNPKVEWPMEERDALDILTLTSLIHRKLDQARKP